MTCVFCAIRDGDVAAEVVLDEVSVLAFLDRRPVFKGHVLAIPREHRETLTDVPVECLEPLFEAVQRLCRGVQAAMGADGLFVAMNNVVSQSVPHLHVHVVPRKRKDGLRGFFWPRTTYASADEMAGTAAAIRAALEPAR